MHNRIKSAVAAVAVTLLGASGVSHAATSYTEIAVANGQKRYLRLVTGTVYTRVCVDEFYAGQVVTEFDGTFDSTASRDPEASFAEGGTQTVNALPPGEGCYLWEYVPRQVVKEATLHETLYHAQIDYRFNPAPPDGDTSYKGCGIAAAQKLLAFYGVNKTQDEIRARIPTIQFGSQIAATPAHVRDGIAFFLQEAGYSGQVVMRNWLDELTARSTVGYGLHVRGAPTLLLVDNGSHYVVAFGWRGGQYHYMGPYDVTSNHTAERHSTLYTQFTAAGIWGGMGAFFSQAYGYTPGTVISVH